MLSILLLLLFIIIFISSIHLDSVCGSREMLITKIRFPFAPSNRLLSQCQLNVAPALGCYVVSCVGVVDAAAAAAAVAAAAAASAVAADADDSNDGQGCSLLSPYSAHCAALPLLPNSAAAAAREARPRLERCRQRRRRSHWMQNASALVLVLMIERGKAGNIQPTDWSDESIQSVGE